MGSSPPRAPLRPKQRLLLRVERFSRYRYRWVFAFALLAVVAAAWLGTRLQLESDVLELIPKGNPRVDVFREALRDFGSVDYLIVLFESEGEGRAEDLEDFADRMAERLRASPGFVENVEYRFQPDERFLELFYENALLFLPPERLDELARRLSDEAIERQVRDNRMALASPAGGLAQRFILHDPLGLMPLFLERLLSHRGALRLDLSDGYYLARDGQALLMLVEPTGPSQDLEFDRRFMAFVRDAAAEVRREWQEENGAPAPVRVSYAGNYALSPEENALILEDARRNLVVSLFAVGALYWLCYRRFAALLYSSVPLVVGQALTFALAFFALGRLNAASSSFTALLMGLGTDFTIVMYARYVEERQAGRDLARSTELMVGETGLGVFTGAITSAGTFYAMCLSSFRGLFDMGFLIGSGILLCAGAILFLLPAMITWNEGVRRRREGVARKLHLQSFLLEHLIPFSARHRAWVLVAVGLLTVAGTYGALGLEFDESLRALRSDRSQALAVQERMAERFGASLSPMMVITRGRDLPEALRRAERVHERLQPFLDRGIVGSYESIATYVPPLEQQRRVLEAVRGDRSGAFDPSRIERTFLGALESGGFRREPFAPYVERMRRFLAPRGPVTVEDLERQGLVRLVDRYVRRSPQGVRIVTYLFPSDERWKREIPPGLEQALAQGDPDIVLTGTNVVGQELRRVFARDIVRSVVAGLVIVFFLLWLDFRSLRLTAVAMAQLLAGVAMMLGCMRLLRVDINYVNAFVATMILGVGIDYGIHLVHRLQWNAGRIEAGLLETGKAVVMAALTNMAGFGTLVLGNYPALKSFGFVALIGSMTCLLTALTLVPALMGRAAPGRPP